MLPHAGRHHNGSVGAALRTGEPCGEVPHPPRPITARPEPGSHFLLEAPFTASASADDFLKKRAL
jgi:hypothetical protein